MDPANPDPWGLRPFLDRTDPPLPVKVIIVFDDDQQVTLPAPPREPPGDKPAE